MPKVVKTMPENYDVLLQDIKKRIGAAQIKASLAVNYELILLYWSIGRDILQRQREAGWGAKVIDQLSTDLCKAFPDIKGFSPRNLKYMRKLADSWTEESIVQQLVAQIPWGHNRTILDKLKTTSERKWYIRNTIANGWSRSVLTHQIESGLYNRQGKAVTNFEHTLPAPQSDLAKQLIKDPYNLEFLTLSSEVQERDLHRGLVERLQDFLIELGVGFAFVGSNYHLEVGNDDFYLDLLFYHLKIRAYFVIELKTVKFQPEFAGKMNFYLSAVDDLLRHPDDQPSIGLILCKSRNDVVAEYTLRDMNKPISVANHQTTESLPKPLQGQLPTVEQLEAELNSANSLSSKDESSQ